jgi:hypothetical protein
MPLLPRTLVLIGATALVAGCAAHHPATHPAGCVTISFKLEADNNATDNHVLDSKPPGMYDDVAIKATQNARYPTPPAGHTGDTFVYTVAMSDDGYPHEPIPVCRYARPPAVTTKPAT